MVADTVRLLVDDGRRVFLDCEHFFDGYAADRDYGVRVAEAAVNAGADVVVLCDTNGGMLPMGDRSGSFERCSDRTGFRLGIHCQDDTGCAVANTVAAVAGRRDARAVHRQRVRRAGGQRRPVRGGRQPDDEDGPAGAAGRRARRHDAGVARARRAGQHRARTPIRPTSVRRRSRTRPACTPRRSRWTRDLYNHLDPTLVGNDMHILITEMAGRASVELKAQRARRRPGRPAGRRRPDRRRRQGAGGRRLVVRGRRRVVRTADPRRARRRATAPDASRRNAFRLESYRVIVENNRATGAVTSEATVKVHVGGRRIIATAEGNGPVNALDSALRTAVAEQFPRAATSVELVDYKVRILAGSAGTDSITRVLVSSASGAGSGRRSACTPTSSRRPGRRWWTRWSTRSDRHGRRRRGLTATAADGTGRCRRRLSDRPTSRSTQRSTTHATGQDRPPRRGRLRLRRRPEGAEPAREIADHPFGTPTYTGRSLAAGRHPAARADPAVEGGRDRPELRRSRRGARQRGADHADDLPQAVDRR